MAQTIASVRETPPAQSGSGLSSSSASAIKGHLGSGQLIGQRYRIVALLGRGGMGEVYRAEDLRLDQPVALKFLPRNLSDDPDRLARFLGEVRIARQISHRNVCRVYDIGEIGGEHYISMEYVDGEDLASLLRRIGRLPLDKGIEIARQLCAGLASAHDKGIVHRDLKPANIMVDGRGMVRIMDFGLAALAGEAPGGRGLAGTPAYMAPEQLTGDPATVKSDLFALGLVLYEMFTGKAAQKGDTVAEITRQQGVTRASPSTIISEIDPVVERAILHCLEADPEMRPGSALSVAAELPGGDPLAAALAAGEVPSPEMVAAAGHRGALRPAAAWACFAGGLLAAGLSVLFSGSVLLVNRVPMEKPAAVLLERSREILKRLGYVEAPTDHASGFGQDQDYLLYVERNDASRERWDVLEDGRPAAVYFWYRESPRHLVAREVDGRVSLNDPPPLVSGMKSVLLDPSGRLMALEVVPPQVDEVSDAAPSPDWSALFAEAGLDTAEFARTDSLWTPPAYSDVVTAWAGGFPDRPGLPIRVEAAAYRGKPVHFAILGPWSRPSRMVRFEAGAGAEAVQVLNVALIVAAMVGSGLLVRRNLKRGWGDRRGAARIALFVFGAQMATWLLSASHVPDPASELTLFVRGAGVALFSSALVWLLYMAIEPLARRRWPERIVSWSRLLTGRLRDPLVGRDILFGTLVGAVTAMLIRGASLIPGWLGLAPPVPNAAGLGAIGGLGIALGVLAEVQVIGLFNAVFFLFFPLLLFIVVRKLWLAIALFFAILVAFSVAQATYLLIALPPIVLVVGLWIFVTMRLGLLAGSACFVTFMALMASPLSLHTPAWFLGGASLPPLMVGLLAAYGLRTAMGR